MTASSSIKTPMMKLPLKDGVTREQGEVFAKGLNKITLTQVLDHISLEEKMTGNV